MKKKIITKEGTVAVIKPDIVRRKVCKTNWWAPERHKRVYMEGKDGYLDLSYPFGSCHV